MPPKKKKTQQEKNAAVIAAIPKPEPWAKSEAKRMLKDDIVTGVVKPFMKPREIFLSRPEFMEYESTNFTTNLRTLRDGINKDQKRMQKDCEYYGHDRALLVDLRQTKPPAKDPAKSWHKSVARTLLKADITAGKHTQMKPSALYMSRREYQMYDPTVFRKHIHQEVDERASRLSRMQKKGFRPRGPAPTQPLENIYDEV